MRNNTETTPETMKQSPTGRRKVVSAPPRFALVALGCSFAPRSAPPPDSPLKPLATQKRLPEIKLRDGLPPDAPNLPGGRCRCAICKSAGELCKSYCRHHCANYRKGPPLVWLVLLTFWAHLDGTHTSAHLTAIMHRENTNAHPPKDADKPAPLHWRQRKKLVARRKQLEEESAARKPQMIAAYVEALGGADRVNPILMIDIERAAELVLLAREMRQSVRQGAAKVADLTRLEGAADRAVRRLNLPPPNAAAPVPTLQDYVASKQAAAEEG